MPEAANIASLEEEIAPSSYKRPIGRVIFSISIAWSLFQLWYASPLPFLFGFGIFNDTDARSIHLAFALLLTFASYPFYRTLDGPRSRVVNWALGLIGSFCALYIFIFSDSLALRVGNPTALDIVVGSVGILLLLEATRRALGPPLMIIAFLFLVYAVVGPHMPEIIAHKGTSIDKLVTHEWLVTEGVFGVALGVSTSFVFLFVLLGALLDKSGAGNYFIKVAFSLLGSLRGGPAKAAVLASGMTGVISGSSIANTVTTGTFTIPLMKKVGFSSDRAGAIEVAASVNGQLMPPVMGAAAFLMVEYVGISYAAVIKHAFLPAIISYIALLYIVHIEALKAGLEGLPRKSTQSSWRQGLLLRGLTISSIFVVLGAVYYLLLFLKTLGGLPNTLAVITLIIVSYLALLRYAACYPPLKVDDPDEPIVEIPELGPTIKSGFYFLLPVVVLIWNLMIERLSPGLSAFWAIVAMIAIVVTQRPLLTFYRNQRDYKRAAYEGIRNLIDGLATGAKNMVPIGVATAAAGIIVGVVSVTGVGAVMTEFVDVISGGSLILILVFTALISLVLGMGLPTTANYIVVSTLMAPVIVNLGAQNGLIVPLIAVHLFVFYYGIMADVTPPVGLAAFAAAAISGADPIKTGARAFFYSARTVLLPFIFIFNTTLLLIGLEGFWESLFIFFICTLAMLSFTAATMGYFQVKNRLVETLLLFLISFMLFRPGFFLGIVYPEFEELPPTKIEAVTEKLPVGDELRVQVSAQDDFGDAKSYLAVISLPEASTPIERLQSAGLFTKQEADRLLVELVTFGSVAEKNGFAMDQEITAVYSPNPQPSTLWIFLIAGLLASIVITMQSRRKSLRMKSGH